VTSVWAIQNPRRIRTVCTGSSSGSQSPSPLEHPIAKLPGGRQIVISDDANLPQTLYLDGRKVEEPLPGAESMYTTAKWKDGKLTVERKLGGNGSIREGYVLDAAKPRLTVDAKLTSGQLQGTLEVRRVYEAGN
jgi:hypothetical protein